MRHKHAVWTLLGMAAVAAVLATVWNASDLGRAARSLEGQRAAARREGVPMEWDDLYRLTPSPSIADNAAVPYARGFEALRAAGNLKGVGPEKLAQAIEAGTAQAGDLAKLRAALILAGPALREIREGSSRKECSFDRRWEKGVSLLFPEFGYARGAGRALVLRAMTATEPAAAGDDLRVAARLRAHIGAEPITISLRVGTSMENDVHRAVRFLGRRGGAWARAVEPVLRELGPLPDMRRSLAGEAVTGMHLNEEIARLGSSAFTMMSDDGTVVSDGTPGIVRLGRFGPVRDAFEARIVEYWREVYASMPKDPIKQWAAGKTIPYPTVDKGFSYALLEFCTPAFQGTSGQGAQMAAERRLSQAALDLWQGREPRLAADPFGTGPLRLRRKGKGWTLWSLGPDGVDGGGKPRVKPSLPEYDLVVESGPK